MTQPPLNAAQPIIRENRTMEDAFSMWSLQVSNMFPIVGTGSPEGVVTAPSFSLYLDDAGTAGNIEWRKMSSDIAGDKSKGWLQV